jgi:hypothetical protein
MWWIVCAVILVIWYDYYAEGMSASYTDSSGTYQVTIGIFRINEFGKSTTRECNYIIRITGGKYSVGKNYTTVSGQFVYDINAFNRKVFNPTGGVYQESTSNDSTINRFTIYNLRKNTQYGKLMCDAYLSKFTPDMKFLGGYMVSNMLLA